MCPLALPSELLPPSHFHPNDLSLSLPLFFPCAKQNAVIIAASHIQIISSLHRFNLVDIFIIFCIGWCRSSTHSALFSLFENKYYWSNLNRKFLVYFSFSKLCSIFSVPRNIVMHLKPVEWHFFYCEREHLGNVHCWKFIAISMHNWLKIQWNLQ